MKFSRIHCVKSIPIWSYSGPHFPAFGLNTERYGVDQNNCEYGNIWRSDSYFNILTILVLENVTDDINSTRQLKDKNNATTTVKTSVTITSTTTLSTSVSTRTTKESETATKHNKNDYLPKFKQKLASHEVSLLISLSLINLCLSLHLLVLS